MIIKLHVDMETALFNADIPSLLGFLEDTFNVDGVKIDWNNYTLYQDGEAVGHLWGVTEE